MKIAKVCDRVCGGGPALSALQALPSSKEKLLGLVNLGKYGCVCILARDATKTVPGDV
jgi:hypothetical protein